MMAQVSADFFIGTRWRYRAQIALIRLRVENWTIVTDFLRDHHEQFVLNLKLRNFLKLQFNDN